MNYILKKLSKRKITKYLGVSMEFVISWTKQSNQDPTTDQRGWQKGSPENIPIIKKKRSYLSTITLKMTLPLSSAGLVLFLISGRDIIP